jgi:hypothetical protein
MVVLLNVTLSFLIIPTSDDIYILDTENVVKYIMEKAFEVKTGVITMHEKYMRKEENLMVIIICFQRDFENIFVLVDILLDVLVGTLMGYEIINTGSRLFQPHFAP